GYPRATDSGAAGRGATGFGTARSGDGGAGHTASTRPAHARAVADWASARAAGVAVGVMVAKGFGQCERIVEQAHQVARADVHALRELKCEPARETSADKFGEIALRGCAMSIRVVVVAVILALGPIALSLAQVTPGAGPRPTPQITPQPTPQVVP